MVKKALLVLFTLLPFFLPAQEAVTFPRGLKYDPFYSLRVTDSDGGEYHIFHASALTDEGAVKYFVWFRRGTDRGLAEYPLDLFKIRRLDMTGNYEVPPDGYTPCTVELTSGSVFEGFLDTTGYLAGLDGDFGTYVRLYLQYNGIRSIEFIHDGTYRRCPFCGALFYNSESDICPFDRTPLEEQNPER